MLKTWNLLKITKITLLGPNLYVTESNFKVLNIKFDV